MALPVPGAAGQATGGAIARYVSLPLPAPREGVPVSPRRCRSHTHTGLASAEGTVRSYSFSGLGHPHAAGRVERAFNAVLPAGSVRSSVFNLCSSTLGAGALSLPLAFREAGYALGLALLTAAACATVFSIWLLIDIYERTDIRTYEESTESLAGRNMRRVVEVCTILFCYGTAVAYIVAVGDTLAPLQGLAPWLTKPVVITGFWAVFMLPVSCLREINALRFTSCLGVAVMLYLTCAVGAEGLQALADTPPDRGPLAAFRWDAGTALSLPVVLFAFTCQVNVFAIYDELEDRRPQRMLQVAGWAMLLCLLVYCGVGALGYARFGEGTAGDILSNFDFPHAPLSIQGTFVSMAVAITTAFPLNVFPLRTTLNLMAYGTPSLAAPAAHLAQTIALVTSMLLVALFVPGVDLVFALLGSTASSLLCFVFPAYLAYCAGSHLQSRAVLVGMVLLTALGLFIGLLGTYCTIAHHL